MCEVQAGVSLLNDSLILMWENSPRLGLLQSPTSHKQKQLADLKYLKTPKLSTGSSGGPLVVVVGGWPSCTYTPAAQTGEAGSAVALVIL